MAELGWPITLGDERARPGGARQAHDSDAPPLLPVLVREGGQTITGVYAIAEFLDEVRGGLFPGDADQRAEARLLVEWVFGRFDWEVADYFLVEKVHRVLDRSLGPPQSAALETGRANLKRHLRSLGALADGRGWLAGRDLSFADFALAGQVSIIDYLGEVPWHDLPEAKAWYARIKSRPSFRPLLADRVPSIRHAAHYENLDF